MRKQTLSARDAWQIVACLVLFLGTGCESQIPKLVDSLNAESSCCSGFSDFDYTKMPTNDEFKFSVGPRDKAYLFPSGMSYFKSFRLPDFTESKLMEVRTYLVGDWIPTAHVFLPFVLFLNESHTLIGDPVVPELYYDEGWWEGSRWTGVVDVPSDAAYVVFFTTPDLVNKKISLGSTSGYAYTTGTGTVYVPPSGERSSSYGPSGELRVRFLARVQ